MYEENRKPEEWKPIAGYEGLYEISSHGRVKSFHYCKKQKTHFRILKPAKEKTGYLSVSLWKDRKMKTCHIHRLVGEAFVPNPEGYDVINHKDESRDNNYFENLEWCTHKYNLSYGTTRQRIAEKNSKPVIQLDTSGNFVKEWPSISKAAESFGYVTPAKSHIIDCLKGRHKTAHGYRWMYK